MCMCVREKEIRDVMQQEITIKCDVARKRERESETGRERELGL